MGPWRGSLKTTTDQEKEVRKMNLAKRWDEFCREEDAMGVVEIILESKAVYGGK